MAIAAVGPSDEPVAQSRRRRSRLGPDAAGRGRAQSRSQGWLVRGGACAGEGRGGCRWLAVAGRAVAARSSLLAGEIA